MELIPTKQTQFREHEGPWLIWSHVHNCWHRKTPSGSAAGYTDDITEAGIFTDVNVARSYHDTGPKRFRRDTTIPTQRAKKLMHQELDRLTEKRDAFARKFWETFRSY